MRLETSERELLDPGFRRAYQPPARPETPPLVAAGGGRLAKLKKGERVAPRNVQVHQHAQPRAVMSEAALIRAMQRHGIGRPSTYAAAVETLVRRGYASRNQAGELASTELGRAVCAYLVGRFPGLFALDFTARMETGLDALAAGWVTYRDVLQSFWERLQAEIDKKAAGSGGSLR